ncbi:MAG: AlbA family DNA-binding domain-containing protein, partial [Blastocatellia bacterium]
SQALEFKSWCKDERELSHQIAEAAVCLANAEGGLVIVGVDDRRVERAAVTVCPHASISADWAKAKIRELTKPPVRCTVARVCDLPLAPLIVDHQSLLVIEVQRTNQPSGHRTSRGVSFVRSYKECRPEYFEDQDDFSRAIVDHLSHSDLDEAAVREAATHRELAFPSVRTLGYRPFDHLIETELLAPNADGWNSRDQDGFPTVAAILLLGKERVVRAEFPVAETVLTLETSINTPLTASKWLNIIDSIRSYSMWIKENLPKTELKIPDDVIRELLSMLISIAHIGRRRPCRYG